MSMKTSQDELNFNLTVDTAGLSDRDIKQRIETLTPYTTRGGADAAQFISQFAAQARTVSDKICWTRGADTVCWTRGGAGSAI